MNTSNQSGAVNVLVFPLIASIMLLIGAVAFGVWAYGGEQDYKNNSDQKSAVAVSAAIKAEDQVKDKQFAEDSKSPFKTYNGPAAFGSIKVSYPKTWGAYIDQTGNGNLAVNGYFYPDFVPADNGSDTSPTAYALRVQILDQSYSTTLQNYSGQVQSGVALTVAPFVLKNVKNVVGSRLEGALDSNTNGSMVIFPLRDKTLEVWTEASQFEADFNNSILPNLTFSP